MNQDAVNEFYNACRNFLEISFQWNWSVKVGEPEVDGAAHLKPFFVSLLKRTKRLACYEASDIEYWEHENSNNLGCFGNSRSTTVASFLNAKAMVASITFFGFENRSIEQTLAKGWDKTKPSDQLVSSIRSFADSFGEIDLNLFSETLAKEHVRARKSALPGDEPLGKIDPNGNAASVLQAMYEQNATCQATRLTQQEILDSALGSNAASNDHRKVFKKLLDNTLVAKGSNGRGFYLTADGFNAAAKLHGLENAI